ncbi:MAG: DUF2142 domain-containing protein [Chloroflexota bacterium]
MAQTPDPSLRAELRSLLAILIVALAHGLLYVFIMPPWQHYDEPTHFERVWLTARLGRSPGEQDYDEVMSRAVVESMVAHHFFDNLGYMPDLSPGAQVRIPGYEHLEKPPLYYWLAAIPVKLVGDAAVETQLYTARLVSLVLYLATVLASWGIARELFRPKHPMRWLLPMGIVLLPGFADAMSAVNGDPAAVAATSFFLWGGLRLVKRGFSVLELLWTLLAAVLMAFSKNTAYPSLLAFPFFLIFALLRGKLRPLAWGLVAVGAVAALVLALRFDDAAYWHRYTTQDEPMRLAGEQAVLGEHWLGLDLEKPAVSMWSVLASQFLPLREEQPLGGKQVTLGLWMWADNPVEVNMPVLSTYSFSLHKRINLTSEPQFFAATMRLPEKENRIRLLLAPEARQQQARWVYYDGVVLVEGEWPADQPPVFTDENGVTGEWGGVPFKNLIRNASFEQAGLRFSPRLDHLGARVLPNNALPSQFLTSILDWPGAGWLWKLSLVRCIHTFWGQFGWGHVALIGMWLYSVLLWVVYFQVSGAVIGAIRRWRSLPWEVVLILGLVFIVSWLAALSRSSVELVLARPYLPVARYAFPVIIATMIILCMGWLEIWSLPQIIIRKLQGKKTSEEELRSSQGLAFSAYLVGAMALDIWSLISILNYYYLHFSV